MDFVSEVWIEVCQSGSRDYTVDPKIPLCDWFALCG